MAQWHGNDCYPAQWHGDDCIRRNGMAIHIRRDGMAPYRSKKMLCLLGLLARRTR